MKKRSVLLFALVLLCFATAVARLEQGRQAQGKQQLAEAVRRTAVACYASEGFYPPSVDYMREKYALTYEEDRYAVRYEYVASNLMPDITVVEK